MYRAISGVDGLVGLSSFCINKLSINEELMRHLYGHVVDILLYLRDLNAKAKLNILHSLGKPVKNSFSFLQIFKLT